MQANVFTWCVAMFKKQICYRFVSVVSIAQAIHSETQHLGRYIHLHFFPQGQICDMQHDHLCINFSSSEIRYVIYNFLA